MDSRRVARLFEVPVVVAALLVIPVVVIEASSSIGRPWTTIAAVLNWLIWVVFVAELVAYLIVVPNRWRWIREHPLEVVIVVLTPPFLPSSVQAIRALRLLRVLRLLRSFLKAGICDPAAYDDAGGSLVRSCRFH